MIEIHWLSLDSEKANNMEMFPENDRKTYNPYHCFMT